MSRRGRKAAAAARQRDRSYVVHLGYVDGAHKSIVFEPRTGRDAKAEASAWTAKKIAEHRAELRWITVFEPCIVYGRWNDNAKIHKWTPAKGWRTQTRTEHHAEKAAKR